MIYEKNEDEYVMSEIRPEGDIYGLCSDKILIGEICEVSSDIQYFMILSQTTARGPW